jgi:hypothetical protein
MTLRRGASWRRSPLALAGVAATSACLLGGATLPASAVTRDAGITGYITSFDPEGKGFTFAATTFATRRYIVPGRPRRVGLVSDFTIKALGPWRLVWVRMGHTYEPGARIIGGRPEAPPPDVAACVNSPGPPPLSLGEFGGGYLIGETGPANVNNCPGLRWAVTQSAPVLGDGKAHPRYALEASRRGRGVAANQTIAFSVFSGAVSRSVEQGRTTAYLRYQIRRIVGRRPGTSGALIPHYEYRERLVYHRSVSGGGLVVKNAKRSGAKFYVPPRAEGPPG